MAGVETIGGNLLDFRFERLTIACSVCARRGVYKVSSLRTTHGNPPMSDLPRLVAMKGGCQLATRYPGTGCDAHFEVDRTPSSITTLAEAYHSGWALILQCERSRQGLKSVRACIKLYRVTAESLVVCLGHEFPIERLSRTLCCPGCGSKRFSLRWVVPPTKPTDAQRAA